MEDRFGVDKYMKPVSEALMKNIAKYGSPEFVSVYNRAFEAIQSAIIDTSIPRPIETAPKDGTYIILLAPSGYTTTPWRAQVGHWDAEYRPLSPWQTHSNDSFTDGGEPPTHWLPLPEFIEVEIKEPREIEVENVMLKVAGKSFRCDCGANVFHHPDGDSNIFKCNGCGITYRGK